MANNSSPRHMDHIERPAESERVPGAFRLREERRWEDREEPGLAQNAARLELGVLLEKALREP